MYVIDNYIFPSCSIITNDVLDIDEPVSQLSVYVWVRSSRLTSLDPHSLVMVTSVRDSESLIPCTPTMPGVRVRLETSGGEVVAGDLVRYQPRQGFRVSRGAAMPSSHLLCHFSDGERSQTVKVQLISSSGAEGGSGGRMEVSLTLVETDADLELDRLELVCKEGVNIVLQTFFLKTCRFLVSALLKRYPMMYILLASLP